MNTQKIKNSRLIVLLAFFINGALLATWVTRIPEIQNKLALSEAKLGLTLLGISIGVLTALSMSDAIISKFGSQKITVSFGILMCLSMPLLAIAPNIIFLWMGLFIFGGTMSVMDVAMNEQAVLVEKATQKPLMSSFHAAYSVGGLVGALFGAFFTRFEFFSPILY